MAAALAPALVQNPVKERSSSPDESARSMQHFLIQESICTSSHTDTDIANLLQEITRLQSDGNQLEQNTDRDIEDIISEVETLVSETSNKVNSGVAPVVNKNNYLPYRRLMRQDVGPKPRVESSGKAVKKKKDMSRRRDLLDDHVLENKGASNDLDLKTILASKIPSKESLNVSEEQFVSSFLQINEATNSSDPVQSPKFKKNDVYHRKLNGVLEKLKDTNEKLQSVQIQYELLVESNKQLKAKNDELENRNKNYETKLLEKDDAVDKLHKDLDKFKLESVQLTTEISRLKEETERLQVDKQNLTVQCNKDKISILDLQRQYKEMEGVISRRHPDSVSALIVASKQPYFEIETKKLLEKRVNDLESETKNIEDKHKKTLSNIHEKVNSMKENYETHIADLEKQVINLQAINSEMKELARHKNNVETSTQTGINCTSATTQTLNIRPSSGKGKNQNSNAGNTQIKEDVHLMATVRGLNTELITKEKNILKLSKELTEAKKLIQKLKDSGTMSKSLTVQRNNDKKQIVPKSSNIKIMKISTNALENNPDLYKENNTKQENEKINSKVDFINLQKDFENLKKKRISDLVELQNSHEKELMSLNLKVLTLQHDVDSLNSTVEILQNQIKSMDKQLSEILIERDNLKYNAEFKTDINSERLIEKRHDRGYDDLRNKIMELEKRYEGREVRLKTLIYSLNKIKDAHVSGIAMETGNCTNGPLKPHVFHSC